MGKAVKDDLRKAPLERQSVASGMVLRLLSSKIKRLEPGAVAFLRSN
jgi:hypothetical protein